MTTQPKLDLPVVARFESIGLGHSELKWSPGMPHEMDDDDALILRSSALSIITPLQEEVERLRAMIANAPELPADDRAWLVQQHKLIADLRVAAHKFREYEELHRAKAQAAKISQQGGWAHDVSESLRKAEVNATLASRFEATIAGVTK